jgi:hypothetical protein
MWACVSTLFLFCNSLSPRRRSGERAGVRGILENSLSLNKTSFFPALMPTSLRAQPQTGCQLPVLATRQGA